MLIALGLVALARLVVVARRRFTARRVQVASLGTPARSGSALGPPGA